MSFTPNIQVFCCHYTSQQAIAEGDEGLRESGFPTGAKINRLACGGKLKVSSLLKAFEEGADGVCLIACPVDQCHNLMGSQRAAHRVVAVKKALDELGAGGDRISMSHLERGFHPEFVEAARLMQEQVLAMGPSPFKEEKQAVAKKPAKKTSPKPVTKKTTKKAKTKPATKPEKKAVKKAASKSTAKKGAPKKAATKPAKKVAKAPAKKGGKKK